jgi:hypothetical protein
MRSSPNFLVVSRRESAEDDYDPYRKEGVEEVLLQDRDTGGRDALEVHVRVSYKTLLAAFLLFDVVRRIVDVVVASEIFN